MADEHDEVKRPGLLSFYDAEAHLDAIRELQQRLRVWRKESADEVAGANENSHVDASYRATFADTACLHALVGALAPFFEGMFRHEFAYIRYLFKNTRPPSENHPRRAAVADDAEFWSPSRYVSRKEDEDDKTKDNIYDGMVQLLTALGIKDRFKEPFPQVVQALFAYRNYALHSGYEGSVERRNQFKKRITDNGWDEWFEWTTVDNEPWLVTMSDKFVEECIATAIKAKNEFLKYRGELDPPSDIPDWMRSYMVEF